MTQHAQGTYSGFDFAAGQYSTQAWEAVQSTLRDIETMGFVQELAAGTLEEKTFTHYIVQDELYLAGYTKAMSLLAAKAPNQHDVQFWLQAAGDAVAEEQVLHRQLLGTERLGKYVADLCDADGNPQPSPTTLGYVSYLIAECATASYEVGVAAVLPCFWVYAHMGKVLTRQVGEKMSTHPYREWIEAYDAEEFDQAVRQAITVYEACATSATEATRQAMRAAFIRATVYEWHFWGAAHIRQDWSLPR